MSRTQHLSAAFALTLLFCVPGHGQDSPSLGDLARQAQKDKSSPTTKKVFTNDDLSSGSSATSPKSIAGLSPGFAQGGQPATPDKQGAASSPAEDLARMESLLNMVGSWDRATLVKNILQGSDVNFPGRSNWEERLFAAKQTYVSQGRVLIQRAKQLEAMAESLHGVQDPNDSRVKDMSARLQQLVQESVRTGAAFQAVILEGKDLASQVSAH